MDGKTTDWVAWHSPYSDPDSALSRRLKIVQTHIRSRLLAQKRFPMQVISVCAGQGRDLLDVLESLPTTSGIKALLVENNPWNVSVAQDRIRQLGLLDTEVRLADAGNSSSYADTTPADLALLCGVFGNISDGDILRTIQYLPHLCAKDATVIWTRSRRAPDVTPHLRRTFELNGFLELAFIAPSGDEFSVGVNRFTGKPQQLTTDEQLFTFL